jgi:WD40 repeat protein
VYSKDTNSFFSSSHDGSVRTWDMRTLKCSDDIFAHRRKNDEGVLSMKLSPAGDKLITGKKVNIKIFNNF